MKKTCLVCRSKGTRPFLEKFGYHLRECLNCGLVFLANPPVRERLYQVYQKGYFAGDKGARGYADYEGDRGNLAKVFSKRLAIIKKYKKRGRLLDVGCATGIFLEEAKKSGFDPFGLDVSPYAISVAQKRAPNRVFLGGLLSFSSAPKFDVITMWDVVEHFLEPKKNLLRASQLLKDNGLLVLTTGNIKSLWAKIAGKNWQGYNPPQHVLYFSTETIKRVLKDTGFKVLRVSLEGKWLSLRYVFHIARGVAQSRLAERLYQAFKTSSIGKWPIYLNLFDSLLVVAAKESSTNKSSE